MKKSTILGLVLAAGMITSYAQGTVNFANAGAGLNSPVFLSDGVTKLSGPTFQAQLLAGPSSGSLAGVGSATPFLTGGGAGIFNGGSVTVGTLTAGGPGFFRVQAWNTADGATFALAQTFGQIPGNGNAFGQSAIFSLASTGNPTTTPAGTPATLIGLTSFNLNPAPEPATLALLGLGAACMFGIRRRKA